MSSSLADKFIEFEAANPQVYELFDRFTKEVIASGFKRYSADAVFHRIRWFTDIETRGDDGFKLSNSHTAFYARLWMDRNRSNDGFFNLKRSAADDLFPSTRQEIAW